MDKSPGDRRRRTRKGRAGNGPIQRSWTRDAADAGGSRAPPHRSIPAVAEVHGARCGLHRSRGGRYVAQRVPRGRGVAPRALDGRPDRVDRGAPGGSGDPDSRLRCDDSGRARVRHPHRRRAEGSRGRLLGLGRLGGNRPRRGDRRRCVAADPRVGRSRIPEERGDQLRRVVRRSGERRSAGRTGPATAEPTTPPPPPPAPPQQTRGRRARRQPHPPTRRMWPRTHRATSRRASRAASPARTQPRHGA